MIGGVTHHILPYPSEVPHLHVNRNPYQIQHYFECIFKLFFKTVFNLFCEIGFE